MFLTMELSRASRDFPSCLGVRRAQARVSQLPHHRLMNHRTIKRYSENAVVNFEVVNNLS
jgi:hypothetical protein